jgi:iron complex transport system substrate-binding protein
MRAVAVLLLALGMACPAPATASGGVTPGPAANDPGAPVRDDPAGPLRSGPARRVISLNPSLTRILLAVGAVDSLVGVDDWSRKTLPEVAGLPAVGGLFNPSLEAAVALAPDLVVLVPSAEQREFRTRLRELGLTVLELDPVGFDDVLETIETLGARVGHDAAAAARVAAIAAMRQRVEAFARGRPRVRCVLVLQRDPLFVAGRGSFVDEMLRMAGAENLAASFDEPWPRVAREWLIEAAPEVLLDSVSDAQPAAEYWARFPSLPAVSAGRVVRLRAGEVTLPGPDLDRALLALVEALHGQAARAALESESAGAGSRAE